MRLSIRWKLILAIGVPLLLVYAGMIGVMESKARARALTQLEQDSADLARDLARLIEERFGKIERSAETLASAIDVSTQLKEEQLAELLDRAVRADPMIHAARIDRTGHEIVTDHALWTAPRRVENGEGPVVSSYTVPLHRQGQAQGTLTFEVATRSARDVLDELLTLEGGFVVLDGEGRFVVAPRVEPFDDESTFFEIAESLGRDDMTDLGLRVTAGETGVLQARSMMLPETDWIFFAPVGSTGWAFVGAMPESAVLAFSRSQFALVSWVMAVGLLLILGVIWVMATRITRPLARLAVAVEGLGSGDLEARAEGVDSKDEIGELARGFNRMVGDLKHHVDELTEQTAAREAVESELRVAREIQASLLPRRFPNRDELEMHGVNIPARHVAGDFYDCFYINDDTLVFLIADVSGKGSPAAMYMAVARTVLRQVATLSDSVADAVRRTNETLEEDNSGSMYITLFVGAYHIPSGRLRYVNAGHCIPYRIDAAGAVTPFGEVGGSIVGILPDREYREDEAILAPGDRLVMYTDGVPEAEAADGEFFGDERFVALLSELSDQPVEGMVEAIAGRIDEYEQGRPHDDVTLLVFRRKP